MNKLQQIIIPGILAAICSEVIVYTGSRSFQFGDLILQRIISHMAVSFVLVFSLNFLFPNKRNNSSNLEKENYKKLNNDSKTTPSVSQPKPINLDDDSKSIETNADSKNDKNVQNVEQNNSNNKISGLHARKKTRRQIEAELKKLKELKEKDLITHEVWEMKQKELLADY